MNMLTTYDQAMSSLSTALNSKQVDVVVKSRDDLELIKLRARQLRDRQLLADATEFQMKVERWLGQLLEQAQGAGHLRAPGHRGKNRGKPDTARRAATLKEIGVDRKLSMKARHAAALDQASFNAAVSDMRMRMASGKAKLVSAVDDAQRSGRRPLSRGSSSFSFLLADGTPLGQVKIGKLRSRIERLVVELEILKAINHRTGSAGALTSVEDNVSEGVLGQIISTAKETPNLS